MTERYQYRDGDPESEAGPDEELWQATIWADTNGKPATEISEAREIAAQFGVRVIDEVDAGSSEFGVWLVILPFPCSIGSDVELAGPNGTIHIESS